MGLESCTAIGVLEMCWAVSGGVAHAQPPAMFGGPVGLADAQLSIFRRATAEDHELQTTNYELTQDSRPKRITRFKHKR